MNKPSADQAVREQALDPQRSCIVQAPAGSGKTELLTQRYLRLLAGVEAPEEIIAITFTRKAAGEMRSRIVKALDDAANETPPQEAHRHHTWELARAARRRDVEREWRLAEHPARLRIQTIDSLNAELTRQMPLLSGFGAQPGIAERPAPLYEEAARRTLRLLEQGDAEQSAVVARLLQHLDNDMPRVMALLADMLPRRDQWLRHIGVAGSESRRNELEQAFRHEIEHQLDAALDAIPMRFRAELAELASHAGGFLAAHGKRSPLCGCAGLKHLPSANVAGLPVWQGLAELLLTKEGRWRSSVDTRLGFEPKSAEKTRLLELLAQLDGEESLRILLHRVRTLPEPRFEDDQWRMLDALLTLLPLSVAELQLLFAERGAVDYAEIALRALSALGSSERPTDLALTLDYRIRHLLVDEFQDTSFNQFLLLERLTAGWQAGDGRSLFVVGDPMQSIYRFREAAVGLFLRAQQHGIGNVALTSLTLSVNFRSQAGVVEWINACFGRIFPAQGDMASGAIRYSVSEAQQAASERIAVQVHPAFGKDPEQEAGKVIGLIRQAHQRQQKVAVLVRGRNHLAALVPRLRREAIRFRAVELERLGERPVVHDLMALTRALLYPADRTAWLAVLRAPWCGLTLADLHVLSADSDALPIAALLQDVARGAALSADGRQRLTRVRELLLDAATQRRRGSLREQVERTWLRLAGPATVMSREDMDDAEAFLSLLENLEQGGTLADSSELESALAQLFARPDPQADDSLQLMTVHRAKGLEFDVVIVPGLGAGSGRSKRPLLTHLERTRVQGDPDLLLAPLNARGSDKDPLYELVFALRREQETLEQQRLLYVAATRARRQLHLLGHVSFKEKDGKQELQAPPRHSLLATLWPVLERDYRQALTACTPSAEITVTAPPEPRLRRLPANWQPPAPPPGVAWQAAAAVAAEPAPELEFEWAGESLRHIGTVVHRLLQRIATDGPDDWDAARLAGNADRVHDWLLQAGVPVRELDEAVRSVLDAIARTLADDTGRMILAARGPDAHSEYALSRFDDGRLVSGVIDRTFVDNEGVRWIVDYKTSRHQGGDLDAFLAREEQRYLGQLARYVQLMRLREQRPLKVGLYFPLLGRFHALDMRKLTEP
ncbi:MAG TPA: UvrD-helicase domain-containing protein [Gammaproteobacteria bacterium]|nr:UvrD-helicase domain-containing protein [Gammaproteobacteria bacterium]